MEGVVVVGVVPVDNPRRHVAFLERRGQFGDRLDRRILYLRIVRMQFAIRRDEVLAAIGHQEALKRDGGIDPVGGQLIAVGVNIAHALRPQLILHRYEEIKEGIPGIRNLGDFKSGLLDQGLPNMERNSRCLHRHAVECTLLGRVVVAVGGAQRRIDILRFLGLDDVADVNELVGPCVSGRNEKSAYSMISGTTPLVIAETSFWRSGANGMMLSSILLPLAFW